MAANVARRLARLARHGRQPEERADADQERKRGNARADEAKRRRPRPEIPTLSAEALKPWLEMFAATSGRPMSLGRTGHDRRLTVIQRCRACGADVEARLPEGIEDTPHWMVEIGALVRHSYQLHRCAPVTVDAAGLDAEQLDLLMRAVELDMLRLGERFKALQAVAAQPRKETSSG